MSAFNRAMSHGSARRRGRGVLLAGLSLLLASTSACTQADTSVASASAASATVAQAGPIRAFGNLTVFEFAPLFIAAESYYPAPVTIGRGSVANLVGEPGATPDDSSAPADIATNAETQALRYSLRNPDMRIVMTVTEGLYRIVARKSAGINSLADLKGKRIATISVTSSGFFTQKMLKTVGLSSDDVTMVGMKLPDMPQALADRKVDAVAIWEPEVERAAQAIGDDAIEFSGKGVYRELFNLNTTAGALANPQMRRNIVVMVRAIIDATQEVRRDPTRAQELVAQNSGYPLELVEKSWSHHNWLADWTGDLLDVLEEEEAWLAKQDKRTPRTRAQLATLIDTSVLEEAKALPPLPKRK
ncbi:MULTISPECIES: ABC transporter substrate-binding protein [unclassified Sphingobium]|uniref:ABC transporter substrate-binding protein n=1 Tax=unclassified Sphingobium TaxID=2611147 RepID=UPI00222508FD|nr:MULTISPECIES: ABC transporter substrate-binding protein [unclassified Sphingobium]MCW2413099.1 NitT/TauT family transport system substrate-binding protein [Sphingobium sp. B8D3D]MCW2414603.1 NitT/TauT family transport system substrate-binding protein [Sphingobium sp. B8D3A]